MELNVNKKSKDLILLKDVKLEKNILDIIMSWGLIKNFK